jgi:hypothetical protein
MAAAQNCAIGLADAARVASLRRGGVEIATLNR